MTVRRFLSVCCILFGMQQLQAQQDFTVRRVSDSLRVVWEVTWGPDNHLWASERKGYISRIDPETGERQELLDVHERMHQIMEGGLLGLALHPDFPDSPYVFTGYIANGPEGSIYKAYFRYTYDGTALVDPVEIFRQEEGWAWHQGGRMKIGPDRKLYITNGELPHTELVQDPSSIYGKTLRMNLDGSIPDDNPYPGSYMWTMGHRNQQGLVFLPDGTLLSAEHGPDTDDEVNILVKGRNYGWPDVVGPADTDDEKAYRAEHDTREPFWTTGPSTLALSGMSYYSDGPYTALGNSLLVTSLKAMSMTQLKLNATHDSIVNVKHWFPIRYGRLRDVCVTPSGRIFIATSNRDGGPVPEEIRPYDDCIYELIPVADDAKPELTIDDDTTVVRCLVGDAYIFRTYIRNTGDAPLNITSAYTYYFGESFNGVSSRIPFSIEPGRSFYVETQYRPSKEGPIDDILHIEIGHASIGAVKHPLRGLTVSGKLVPDHDAVVFPTFDGSMVDASVTFTNVGNDTITLQGVMIGGDGAESFRVQHVDPVTVAVGEKVTVPVEFYPYEAGTNLETIVAELTPITTSYFTPVVVLQGTSLITSVADADGTFAPELAIAPNPSTSRTSIMLRGWTGDVELSVTDMFGRIVWSSIVQSASMPHIMTWNGTSDGPTVTAGTYIVTARAGHRVASRLLIRE
ncbi:MAG: PQQ-dependent sugar dehydrogenase ['Candidatus Kapabacteria' thiocyanatum]|nr:PQQ-dependent sugar dehydrogenase ['Candidatus Kapabacteria' thiocyanatum]